MKLKYDDKARVWTAESGEYEGTGLTPLDAVSGLTGQLEDALNEAQKVLEENDLIEP